MSSLTWVRARNWPDALSYNRLHKDHVTRAKRNWSDGRVNASLFILPSNSIQLRPYCFSISGPLDQQPPLFSGCLLLHLLSSPLNQLMPRKKRCNVFTVTSQTRIQFCQERANNYPWQCVYVDISSFVLTGFAHRLRLGMSMFRSS